MCKCSQIDYISASQVIPCDQNSANNDTSLNVWQVFNTSMLFDSYEEVMMEVEFKVPGLKSQEKTTLIHLSFGDDTADETFQTNSTIIHVFVQEGRFKVSGYINQSNQVSLILDRDVITQKPIPDVRMACPTSALTMHHSYCSLNGLKGSSINVEIEARVNGSLVENVTIAIPDEKRTRMGYLAPLSMDEVPINKTQGTYILPGIYFRETTIIEAWEIIASRKCSVKLQVFRPTVVLCRKPRVTQPFCAKWFSNPTCNPTCIYRKQYVTNTTLGCLLTKPPYQSISSFDVELTSGYNFVLVPEQIESAYFGDVVGWTSYDANCIKTVSSNQSNDALFWRNQTRFSYSVNETNNIRKTFAVRIHGSSQVDYQLRYCSRNAEIVSFHAKFSNQLTSRNVNTTITYQKPITGFSYNGIAKFLVVNESRQFVFKAEKGTNLSFVLHIEEKEFSYKRLNQTTDGFAYSKNITFSEIDESVYVSYLVFNLVSKKSQSFLIKVRIRVLGLRASLTYTDGFMYQGAKTYLNTSISQGNYVSYDWLFEKKPFTTASPETTYIWKNLGYENITLYAHNSASYEKYVIPTRVISNPLTLTIPQYVEAGVTQIVACKLIWLGGSPSDFFQQMNLVGKKGTNAPDKVELVLDFGDGRSIAKNTTLHSSKHTFTRNRSPGYHVSCTLKDRPEINIQKTVKAIDKIAGLQIKSDCLSSIKKGSTCNFKAITMKGDDVRCKWKIRDGSVIMFVFSCSVRHAFVDANPGYVIVNVSNGISWSESKKNFTLMKFSSTPTLQQTTSTNIVKSTSAISLSQISLSTSFLTISTSSAILPSIKNTSLECPLVAFVGQKTSIRVSSKNRNHMNNYEWYINEERLPPHSPSINHVFKQQGIYRVTCKVSNGQEETTVRCHLPVQYQIAGFKFTRIDVLEESLARIHFQVLQGTNVTYKVDYGDGGASHGHFTSFPAKTLMTRKYFLPNEYLVKISVTSLAGPNTTITKSITITAKIQCIIYDVTLQGVSQDKLSIPSILPQNEYSISPSLKVHCESTMTFKWGVIKVHNETFSRTYDVAKTLVLDEREFGLPPHTLVPGLYKITLTVASDQHNVSRTGFGFLSVRETGLVVLIECGRVQTVSREKEVVLNASLSYDPDKPNTGNQSLLFNWSCREKDDSWFGNMTRNAAVLRLPSQWLQIGNYSFVVEVTTREGRKKASTSQRIHVVDYDAPELCIRCIDNCGPKVLLFKPVILSVKNSENSSVDYKWEISEPHHHHVTKRAISKPRQFVITHTDLQPNKTYTITLEAVVGDILTKSEYVLRTDDLPVGGRCQINPQTGKTIETPFQITCGNWADKDRPLWYEFFYNDSIAGWMLMSYGWSPNSPILYLPPGSPENNNTISLKVDIVDTLGSRTIVPLKAQVMGFDASDGPVSAILNGYVQGPSSKLGKMLIEGEQQQAFQLMTTISTVLNQDSSIGNPAGHLQREQVRLVMTKELASGCCSSLPNLRQVLGGLYGTTRVPKEVTPDSQINGAEGYEKMAKSLATKYQHNSIESESKGIVSGLSDVLEASEISTRNANENKKTAIDWLDDKNTKGNEEALKKSNKATQKCLTGAEQVARALVRRKKTGEEATTVKSSKLQIAVHREEPSSVSSKKFDKTGTTFVMPHGGLVDKFDKLGFVDTKVLTLQQSPFQSEGNTPISSSVSSLELQDPKGDIIAVNNLSHPIAIFLENTANDQQTIHDVIDACKENITVYKINITEPNVTVRLEVNCSSSCSVYWQKTRHPTSTEYDFRWNITSGGELTMKLLTWQKHLNGTGEYFLGIFHKNLTNQSCTLLKPLVFNITVNVVSCMYWDDQYQKWNTHGCTVGPETNQQQIHCLCNHLTWFGSKFFVPPNKLDIKKIAAMIKDPSNYAALLSVLCTIWVVYILVVVWARREDKKDELKVGVCISPNNKPGDNYIYQVIVTTGIRRSAGTTANTAIMLYGEIKDSDPYLLTDIDTHRTLQRGVSHTFLLTTKESLGQLLHIQIWHDNQGRNPALFLKEVSVRDVQTKKIFYFMCNRWFAVDEGDGLIDRVLPLTSDEEMAQFTQMFLSKTKKDLTDSHLWFSVVWRPPHSVFTRVQRVSCCLSLLLCTMMANAMWYKADEERYTRVDLGPFEFSWEQVSIGIMSSFIVFPINVLLVQIFRLSKSRKRPEIPKRSTSRDLNKISPFECLNNDKYSRLRASSVQIDMQSDRENSPKHRASLLPIRAAAFIAPTIFRTIDSDNSDLIQNDESPKKLHKEKKKGFKGLPYWCVYVGWVVVGATSLAAAAVTALYGIQFGKRTSEKWLLSMLVSVTQDIFVSQPVKVIAIAVVFAFIIKKPQFNEKENTDDEEKQQWLSKCNASENSSIVIHAPPTKPSEETLEMARKRLQQEKQMGVIMRDIISYLLFLLIMLLIAYGQRDKSSFLQKESIEGLLLRRNYSGLQNGYLPDRFDQAYRIKDIWKWLENLVFPVLYNVPWYLYAGKPTSFVQGGSGMIVGVARLRQLRVSEGGCSVVEDASSIISKCRTSYSTDDEDQKDYDPGWKILNSSKTDRDKPSSSPWQYNSALQLTGFPFIGNAEIYSGGGYVLTMSRVYYKALKQLDNAKRELWVDTYSRAIFMEFNLYNPSSNLFTACTVLMEVLPTGGFIVKHQFLTYRLYRYVGDFQLFIVAMEVFFLMFIVYFTYREGKKLYIQRRKFFAETWNWLEMIIVILAWASIAHYFICFGIRRWTLKKYLEHPDVFTNFHYISAWQVVFENLMALTVFAGFLKMIKLLSFNKRMYLFAHTLRHALSDIINFVCIFLIVFIAFAQLYYFMLGSEYKSFSSMIGSMAKLMSVMLGKFNFDEFMNPFRILGAISFIAYMLFMKFFLLNILIVLIISSFQQVKHSNNKLQNDFEMIDFVVDQFKSMTGIRTKWKIENTTEETRHFTENKHPKALEMTDLKTKTTKNSNNAKVLFLRVSELETHLAHQHISETFDEAVDRYVMKLIQTRLLSSL